MTTTSTGDSVRITADEVVLSFDAAERLVEQTFAVIDPFLARPYAPGRASVEADRERLIADLDGLGEALDRLSHIDSASEHAHARRYSDGILRTARLHGALPPPARKTAADARHLTVSDGATG